MSGWYQAPLDPPRDIDEREPDCDDCDGDGYLECFECGGAGCEHCDAFGVRLCGCAAGRELEADRHA